MQEFRNLVDASTNLFLYPDATLFHEERDNLRLANRNTLSTVVGRWNRFFKGPVKLRPPMK